MKKALGTGILWMLLLCLCGLHAAGESVTKQTFYEEGIARLDEMSAESVAEAADYFIAAGNYEFAQNYRQYAISLQDILLREEQPTDLDTAILRLQMISGDEAFSASLAENQFPSCDQLIAYIRAYFLERDGDYDGARKAYASIPGVLDSMDRQIDLVPKVYEQADSLYQRGDYEAAAGIFQELSLINWKDSEEKYQQIVSNHEHQWTEATCTEPRTCRVFGETEGEPLGHDWQEATYTEPKTCRRCGATEGTVRMVFGFNMTRDEFSRRADTLARESETWTADTAPRTLDQFPLVPDLEVLKDGANPGKAEQAQYNDQSAWKAPLPDFFHDNFPDTVGTVWEGFEEPGRTVSRKFEGANIMTDSGLYRLGIPEGIRLDNVEYICNWYTDPWRIMYTLYYTSEGYSGQPLPIRLAVGNTADKDGSTFYGYRMDGSWLVIFYKDGDTGWICFYSCDAADGVWKLETFEREG